MICVENLHFTYAGAAGETLTGMDFHVGRGEIFGFLGPSGAGKSTAQKILTGILRGYKGSVRVMGDEVRRKKTKLLRTHWRRNGDTQPIRQIYSVGEP